MVAGSVLVDVLLYVDRLPEPGGDVVVRERIVTSGGGFNLLAAARRLGLPAAYAGTAGSGPFGEQVAADLAREGIPVLLPRSEADTGFVIGIVDGGEQTTYLTAPGVESRLTDGDLASVPLQPGDAVYLSGYDLLYEGSGASLERWLPALPEDCLLAFDPGPLVGEIPPGRLERALARTDVLSVNRTESQLLTGEGDPGDAVRALTQRIAVGGLAVVRTGADGCVLCSRGETPIHIPPRPAHVADPTGAGDTHLAALLVGLAAGCDAREAALRANVAASLSVERHGPATGPTAEELARALSAIRRGGGSS